MRRVSSVRGFVSVGLVGALVTGLVFVGMRAQADGAPRFRLVAASAWLASLTDGTVSHVNGTNGKVDARVQVGNGHPFHVIQREDGAYVVDDVTGAIAPVDGATQKVGAPAHFAMSVDVLTGAGKTFVVDRATGSVQEVNGANLAPVGARIELGGAVGSGVVDESGTSWLPLVGTNQVASVAHGVSHAAVVTGARTTPVVVLANQRAVAVDATTGAVQGLTDTLLRTSLPPTSAARSLVVGASDAAQVAVVSPTQVTVADLQTKAVSSIPVTLPAVSQSVLAQQKLYLLDASAGAVRVIDLATRTTLEPITVPDGQANELLATNGLVVVNDKNGAQAVTVDHNGHVAKVDKYQVAPKIDTTAPVAASTTTAPPLPPPAVPTTVKAPPSRDPVDATKRPSRDNGAGSTNETSTTTAAPRMDEPTTTTTTLVPAPGAPTSVQASPQEASIDVSWKAPSDNDTPVTGYSVAYGTDGVATVAGNKTTLTLKDLANGTEICVRVQALYAGGAGPWSTDASSNCATPSVDKPTAPGDLRVGHGNESLSLSWTEATKNRTDVDHYTVKVMNGANEVVTRTVSATTRSASFNGLTNGVVYSLSVTATSKAEKTGDAATATEYPSTAPTDMRNVHIDGHDGYIGLDWGPPDNYETMGDPVTYVVTYNGIEFLRSDNFGAAEIRPATNGQSYTVVVTATNRDGSTQTSKTVVPGP